jgi:hypothetical protein
MVGGYAADRGVRATQMSGGIHIQVMQAKVGVLADGEEHISEMVRTVLDEGNLGLFENSVADVCLGVLKCFLKKGPLVDGRYVIFQPSRSINESLPGA